MRVTYARMNVELRRIRRAADITQQVLAAKSGVDQTTISRIEIADSRRGAKPETIEALANGLRSAIDERIQLSTNDDLTRQLVALRADVDTAFPSMPFIPAEQPARVPERRVAERRVS